MARSIILISILLLGWQSTYTGNWRDADGTLRDVPCPESFEERARMPKGCVAKEMGVWLSREYYTQLVVNLSRLKKEKEERQKLLKLKEDRIKSLELQLKLKVVAPAPAPSCFTEILSTTILTTAGCVVWNQLP